MDDVKKNMDDFVKNNPFTIPDNFFEHFNAEVMANLPEKKAKKVHFNFRKYVLPWAAAAAVLSGVFFTMKDVLFTSDKTPVGVSSSSTGNEMDFASSEDRDFYLFLQDDAARKEITSGNYSE